MAQKSKIRSIRFTEKMIEMIESQVGDTFTAKFEALVTRCMWELPKREEELKRIQKLIQEESSRLENIQKKTLEIENNAYRLNRMLENYYTQVRYTVKSIESLLGKE